MKNAALTSKIQVKNGNNLPTPDHRPSQSIPSPIRQGGRFEESFQAIRATAWITGEVSWTIVTAIIREITARQTLTWLHVVGTIPVRTTYKQH